MRYDNKPKLFNFSNWKDDDNKMRIKFMRKFLATNQTSVSGKFKERVCHSMK